MSNDDQKSGGSNASSIPVGLEDLSVSHLRRPTLEKASASDQEKVEEGQQTKNESQESDGMVPKTETAGESSSGTGNDDQVPPSIPLKGSGGTHAVDDES
ncbi:unnamed protein product [Lactuca virosa]|uniref:Uncharacterized protein n=1 Tax=Lactuca virosa TaxID=75947 RepID=A0AAU9M8C2_9ASTR|nr:unnamed protein product [Lactuca virosa]